MKGFVRPESMVLPSSAAIPDRNLIVPPPNQFTHEISRPASYWYDNPGTSEPAGELAAGTPVVLLVHDGGRFCGVADSRGLYVATEHDALRRRSQEKEERK
jgi:hypothetical protein